MEKATRKSGIIEAGKNRPPRNISIKNTIMQAGVAALEDLMKLARKNPRLKKQNEPRVNKSQNRKKLPFICTSNINTPTISSRIVWTIITRYFCIIWAPSTVDSFLRVSARIFYGIFPSPGLKIKLVAQAIIPDTIKAMTISPGIT
ncbi:MAG: hypothetical protein U5N58_14940 [Actinomycetota bacterium]|nr:hypothetical protein [Actinomycetota bacterium]